MLSASSPTALAKMSETLLSKCEIPIIDLAHVGTERCPQKSVVKQVGSKLVQALSEKGLALLVNHGIPDCKLKPAYRAFDKFCELPDEDRDKYEYHPVTTHGYVKPGDEKLSTTNEKELRHSFNICGDGGPLPDPDVPGFSTAMEDLSRDFKQLATMLLTALAVGMEQPPDFFLSKHSHLMASGNGTTLRMLYYPSICAPEPNVTRCGAHCDYGTFTLLAQDREGGLEIQTPSGLRWVRVGHLPGAILMNTGEILDSWTNGQLPALRHRVVVPEHYGRGRHSVAFFVHPDNDVEIEPFDVKIVKPVQETAPCRLQKKKITGVLTAYQHLQRRFRETYAS